MAFRSHVARPFDFRLWSNRILFILVGVFGVAAIITWANGAPAPVLWAPAHVFVAWAMMREIDPDSVVSAPLIAVATGTWVLLDNPAPNLLAAGGIVLAARVTLNSTGRRPLISDLVALGLIATVISSTRVGWVAGVGLAVAIYVDGRLAEGPNPASVATAGLAALGASIVATAAGAFAADPLGLRPVVVVAVGVVAIVTILRSPPEPVSLVDSRIKWRLDLGRLHASRSLVAVLVFVSTLLYGEEAPSAIPLAGMLLIALVSAEVERARRRV